MSVPAADELFRSTEDGRAPAGSGKPSTRAVHAVPDAAPEAGPAPTSVEEVPAPKRASGRVRHDEKMTVYVTAEELLEIEHARLALRAGHGLAVDRGRLVREALHLALADLEAHGGDSALVRRLSDAG